MLNDGEIARISYEWTHLSDKYKHLELSTTALWRDITQRMSQLQCVMSICVFASVCVHVHLCMCMLACVSVHECKRVCASVRTMYSKLWLDGITVM